MRTSDFDYDLPDHLIAQEPLPRGESRLLDVGTDGSLSHRQIRDLPEILRPGDLLVVNDTRVIPARLFGRGSGGGKIELLLSEKVDDREWLCLARPGRKTRTGATVRFDETDLEAEVTEVLEDGRRCIEFSKAVEPHLENLGHVPLPPYIRRPDRPEDRETYQTLFAKIPGAIAAPTAGLHFDNALMEALAQRGIDIQTITLHVGIGTFKPVSVEDIQDHRMDSERYEIDPAAAQAITDARSQNRRIVAVGTTTVRTLEAAAIAGNGQIQPGSNATDLFITPGFPFQIVDALLTNFHLPRSTLLMLVSALSGQQRIRAAYKEAIQESYRFYSYGDAMLTRRTTKPT